MILRMSTLLLRTLREDPADDTFLFHQGPTKGLGKIRFHDFNIAYNRVHLPNVELFKEQVEALKIPRDTVQALIRAGQLPGFLIACAWPDRVARRRRSRPYSA